MLWAWAIITTLLLIASTWLNIMTIRKNLALNDQKEDLVDKIEESLDIIDSCYARMSHHAEVPVLSDEPLIREVVADIRRTKNAIHAIASKVVMYGSDNGSDSEENWERYAQDL